jgi:hypothetical protein
MFIELSTGNYATHDGIFNGANAIFKFVTSFPNNESFIWIQFLNSKAGINTQAKNHVYIQQNLNTLGHLSNPSPKKSK